MIFDVKHDGSTTLSTTRLDAIDLGYPLAVISAAMKASAYKKIEAFAEIYREKLAISAPGKLAEYGIKAEIAADDGVPDLVALAGVAGRDATEAVGAELALIDRMAAAAGKDRASFLAVIAGKAIAYRKIVLLVAVIEAEAKAEIEKIPDDADDIEGQIEAVFISAKAEADTAFSAAEVLLNTSDA